MLVTSSSRKGFQGLFQDADELARLVLGVVKVKRCARASAKAELFHERQAAVVSAPYHYSLLVKKRGNVVEVHVHQVE